MADKWILKTILVFSLPAPDKSTLGNKLAQKLDCGHLNVDQARKISMIGVIMMKED